MPEYHVGCGLHWIYAGTMNRGRTDWANKSEVTQEAYAAVFQHIKERIEARKELRETYKFSFRDGVVLEVSCKIKRPKEARL